MLFMGGSCFVVCLQWCSFSKIFTTLWSENLFYIMLCYVMFLFFVFWKALNITNSCYISVRKLLQNTARWWLNVKHEVNKFPAEWNRKYYKLYSKVFFTLHRVKLQRNSLYRCNTNLEGILRFSVPSIILKRAGLMHFTM